MRTRQTNIQTKTSHTVFKPSKSGPFGGRFFMIEFLFDLYFTVRKDP